MPLHLTRIYTLRAFASYVLHNLRAFTPYLRNLRFLLKRIVHFTWALRALRALFVRLEIFFRVDLLKQSLSGFSKTYCFLWANKIINSGIEKYNT